MYLKLTTAFNPGMNDAGNTYPILSITSLTDNANVKALTFIYEMGSFQMIAPIPVNGVAQTPVSTWVKGAGALSQSLTVSGAPYAALIATTQTVTGDTPYKAIYRALYLYLAANGNAGTIVDA